MKHNFIHAIYSLSCLFFILLPFHRGVKLLSFSSPATSGDTGGSAIQSAKGLRGLDVVVVYPRGRITPVQEKQMITCLEENIHVFAGKTQTSVP